MTISAIQTMLQTRIKAADDNGNHTEKSFLYELWKMSEELKSIKGKKVIENELQHNDT